MSQRQQQRKSFLGSSSLGSLKEKLTRKSSTKSQVSAASPNSAATYNEQPPPYSATAPTVPAIPSITVHAPVGSRRGASPAPSRASQLTAASMSTPEDPYAFLSEFDTVFLIDDSGSMAGSRWREVKEVLRQIAPICTAHDDDGIDVYFFNSINTFYQRPEDFDPAGGFRNIKDARQVENLFNSVHPKGMTPTGARIHKILGPYVKQFCEEAAEIGTDDVDMKPINLIVITDGEPSDDPEGVITALARKLDKVEAPSHQVGIQFFQVGNDLGAAKHLEDLDDFLSDRAKVRDMVDTVSWNQRSSRTRVLSAEAILKVVLGAVVRRLDRTRNSIES